MKEKNLKIGIGITVACVLCIGGILYGQHKQKKAEEVFQPQPTTITATLALTPEPTATPTLTPTPEPTATPTLTPTPEPTATPTLTPTPEPTATPTVTPTPEPTATPTPKLSEEDAEYAQYDNTKQAWWFRRNTNHEQSGSGEAFDIAPFDAYYVDKQAIDEEKVFYLTFDCGYENGFTPAILDVLKEQEVPAMFFVTEHFLKSYPEYVKRMKEEGHLVGNHTVRHLSSPDLTPEELKVELDTIEDMMLNLTGYEIDPFFRPPMGEYSKRTLQVTKDLGYKSIFWSIAYYDYDVNDQPGKEYVVDHFKTYHHSGAIALLHNVSESNTQALEDVILFLKAEGYRFASLKELQ